MSARVVLFWLLALMLFAAVTAVVVWPLLRRPRRRALVRKEVNVQVLRDQLAELELDMKAGTLSESQYAEAKQDISRRLLDDLTADPIAPPVSVDPVQAASNRRLAYGLMVAMPVLTISAYLWLGTPVALQGDDTSASAGNESSGPVASNGASGAPVEPASANAKHAVTPEKINAMIEALRKKVDANPGDGPNTAMLARAYNFEGKFQDAVTYYKKAIPLNPKDAELLADYADALAMTQNRTLGAEPMQLERAALAIDGSNAKALALSATEAFQRKDFKAAIEFWQRALPAAQARDPDLAQQLKINISEANQLGGGKLLTPAAAKEIEAAVSAAAAQSAPPGGVAGAPGPVATAAPASDSPAAPSGVSVSGRVTLSAALKAKTSPEDSVFIFAKAASGPPMPLAVLRAKVSDLPMNFRLDESMAMMPGLKLGNFPAIVVGARISKSGNAIPASGDLQGTLKGVKPGASDLLVDINEQVP